MRRGILPNDKMTKPAKIEFLDKFNRKTLIKVIIEEVRDRNICKIVTLLGYPVQDLQRILISNINSNNLQEGKWRELKTKEWVSIIN